LKTIIYFFNLMILSSAMLISSDKVFTLIDIDDIDPGGVNSRSNMGCMYNLNKFYVFYPGFHQGDAQRIKVRELELLSDGKIKKHGMTDLNDIQFPAAVALFDSKMIVVAHESGNQDGKLLRMSYNGKWSDSHSMPNHVNSKCGVALTVLNNKLYCFYKYTDGSIRLITSKNGESWSDYKEVVEPILDSKHGTIAACTFIDKDKKSRIFLGFSNKDNNIMLFRIINEDGSTNRKTQYENSVNNISLVQGSTKGATKGNIIQILYSSWHHNDHRIYKKEYVVDENHYVKAEELTWDGGNSTILGSKDDFVAGSFHVFEGGNSLDKQKYLISFVSRFYKNSDNDYERDMRLYSWKSDMLKFNRDEGVVYDYDPDPKLCQLIGVIEGPPPYTSNGYEFGDWGPQGYFPPSSLEYGVSNSISVENSSNISTSLDLDVNIGSFGGGFGYEVENTESVNLTKTITNFISIEPTEHSSIGYKVFSKPIIQRKKYHIYDWDNNDLKYSINLFKFKGPFIVYEPYNLTEVNSLDLYSYLNRNRDFENYSEIKNLNFEWSLGSSSENTVKLDKEKQVTTSKSESISVGNDTEFGEIFKVESEFDYTLGYSLSTTTKMNTEFALNFNCPGNAEHENHIKIFKGKFYWIKPTKDKDNWWVPKEYQKDNPWLMTYNLTEISKNFGEILSIEDKSYTNKSFEIYPNPATEHLIIKLNSSISGKYAIIIKDIFNKTIKTFNFDNNGNRSIFWNLTDENGNKLTPGIYFTTIYISDFHYTNKFIIIK
jgi:hypothetical protein